MVSGSHMHGTDTVQSDIDVRGVTFAPPATVVGLGQATGNGRFKPFELWEDKKNDMTVFSLSRFAHLLLKSSPNAIEMLFAPYDNHIHRTAVWDDLQLIRMDFVSSRLADSFRGHAHQAWMLTTNTTAVRRPIVERFGYDPKSAAHAIRLLQEGAELLTTGTLTYPRPNAEWLKSVKLGELTFTTVRHANDEAGVIFNNSATATTLPDAVSSDRLIALLMTANFQNLQQWSCHQTAKS